MTITPFHIQELAEEIGGYLEQTDLAYCARVCKIWHSAFSPLLHQHIVHSDVSRKKISLWTGIQRYSCHTRSLTVATSTFPELQLLGTDCRRITTLSLGPCGQANQPRLWCTWVMALIACNPSIHTLRFHLSDPLDHTLFRERNILEHLPELKHLSILNDRYPVASSTKSNGVFESILAYGSQLESLSYEVLYGGPILEVGCVGADISCTDSPPWTNLASLTIHDIDGRRESELLKHCSYLKHYMTKVDFRRNGYESLHQLAHSATTDYPLCLEHLEVSQMQGPWTAGALDDILRASAGSPGLKTFSVIHSGVSDMTMKTLLTHHAVSLEKVVMNNVPWTSPSDLLVLLTACPQLRHLETAMWSEKPWMKDLVQVPWKCFELQFLHLKTRQRGRTPSGTVIQWDPSEYDADSIKSSSPQRQFWSRIGALKKLRSLHLNTESRHRSYPKPLSFLREDIKYLCGLKQLQEFQIPPWPEFMSTTVKDELLLKRPGLLVENIDEMQLLS